MFANAEASAGAGPMSSSGGGSAVGPPPSNNNYNQPASTNNTNELDAPASSAISADIMGHSTYLETLSQNVNPSSAIMEMQHELSKSASSEKTALVYAQQIEPGLLSEEHVLMFLWAENFNARVSLV
jgi:hypothetical protein